MITLLGLALLGLMQDAATPVVPGAPGPELDPGALFERVLALDRGGDEAQAFELVERELERGEAWSEDVRARLYFARGVLESVMPAPPAPPDGVPPEDEPREPGPVASFSAARALAGSGHLREHASYNLGTYELAVAEELRAQIPEIAQASGAPVAQGAPGPLGGPPGPPPPEGDPLPKARAAYLVARSSLIERLRLEPSDPDTRANLQLILRRLRELDQIEQQREEQQEEQQESDQEGEPDENSEEQEESEDQESSESEEQGDQEQEGQEQEEEERQPQDPEEKPDPDPDQLSEEQQQELEQVPQPEGEPQQQARPEAPSERLLTREEVMRLFDRLEELEEEGRQLEAAIQAARRIPVKRDW